MDIANSFGSAAVLRAGGADFRFFRLATLEEKGVANVSRLPFTTKIMLENLLRHEDGRKVSAEDIDFVARGVGGPDPKEISFMPARVLLQDFTGVPAVVDLAAMRDALKLMGADATKANPLLPADLVIDHSVQVDEFGSQTAFSINALLEFQRNRERYALLRWGQTSFANFRVVPPDTGIVHQVNLEYLAPVIFRKQTSSGVYAYPDTVVGTDSHTTMINGLGVVGWGVGGIEAEACMLGQAISMLLPPVVGFKLFGALKEGCTATDLVLTITQILRKKGVVGKFVEFYGSGLSALSLADRATVANMAPEYGATVGFFPIDTETLNYLRASNRPEELVNLIEVYAKEQGLFRTDDLRDPLFSDSLEFDLAGVVPSMAGPRRPQDRVTLPDVPANFQTAFKDQLKKKGPLEIGDFSGTLESGAVVIAAITSCTNTSNPSVMMAAGLLAKKAVEKGLMSKPWVKTSLAPGSKVVYDYLTNAGLMHYLEVLKFNLVGYGCTTCIGNSGPLPEPVAAAIQKEGLVAVAVLSGNRNFEGRINSLVKANYLASPPLVVAYALAGRVDLDMQKDPLGTGTDGKPVYLRDIWPTTAEIQFAIRSSIDPEMFRTSYEAAFEGDASWRGMDVPTGETFVWDPASTYIKKPPYFENMMDPKAEIQDLCGMRVLAMLGDSVTTDHISPAGSIPADTPAGKYLISMGVSPKDFNSYGARRGNHEVMVRGTLANIRLKNQMAPGTEGGYTSYQPDGEQMFIYDASMKYQANGVALMILAGKEYGSGSSRDWAAKGVNLLGVKAVIAESFERIHRTNLVGMGVLPLQYLSGDTAQSLKLNGKEQYSVLGVSAALSGKPRVKVVAAARDGSTKEFDVLVRVDTPQEAEYFRNGGILPFVLRQLAAAVVFHQIEKAVAEAFAAAIAIRFGIEKQVTVEQPKQFSFGELAVPAAFQLARELKQPPRKIAEQIVEALEPIPGVKSLEIAGNGYVNIRLHRGAFADAALHKSSKSNAEVTGKIIVEHTNINPNKAAHIGHLRNAVLGDTFVRMLRAGGRHVEVQNYIDNTGVQVADVVVGFHFLEKKTPADVRHLIQTTRFDYHCWDLYARTSQYYKDEPNALAWRSETLHAIEADTGDLAEMAHLVADAIVELHLNTMLRLGVEYDVLPRESEILHLKFWAAAFERLKSTGAILLETEGKNAGCWVMPASAFSTDTEAEDGKVIVRSNGTVTYVGKDIAYQMWKFGLLGKDFYYRPLLTYPDAHQVWVSTDRQVHSHSPEFGHAHRVYNVIDSRQSYLQDVVVAGLRAMGARQQADQSIHFSYEMVALSPRCCVDLGIHLSEEDRKRPYVEVSGRKGLGVKADDLIDQLIKTALREVESRHADDAPESRQRVATEIAIGALRYFLLKFTRNTVIAFDFQEALSFEGETGPYAQYAAVRARNILKKLTERGEALPNFAEELNAEALTEQLESEDFWQILVAASKADSAVERAVTAGEPSHVARYAFQLAQLFNNFYHQYQVLTEPDRKRKVFLLWMTDYFRAQLETVLGVLGILVPDYM